MASWNHRARRSRSRAVETRVRRKEKCGPAGRGGKAGAASTRIPAVPGVTTRRRRAGDTRWQLCVYGPLHCSERRRRSRTGCEVCQQFSSAPEGAAEDRPDDRCRRIRVTAALAMPRERAVQARSRSGIRTRYREIRSRALPMSYSTDGTDAGRTRVAERARGTAERPRARRRTASDGMLIVGEQGNLLARSDAKEEPGNENGLAPAHRARPSLA